MEKKQRRLRESREHRQQREAGQGTSHSAGGLERRLEGGDEVIQRRIWVTGNSKVKVLRGYPS